MINIPCAGKIKVELQAIPDSDSYFVRWEKIDGSPVEGQQLYAKPGDTIFAIFKNKQ